MSPEVGTPPSPSADAAQELVRRLQDKAKAQQPRHFVDEVELQAKRDRSLYEPLCRPSAQALDFLISQLSRSQRIRIEVPLVPDGGQVEKAGLLQDYAIGLALPVSEPLAIEYEHGGVYDSQRDLTHALSTRRLALVVPMVSETAVTLDGLRGYSPAAGDEGALLVWSINYFEEKREWEFSPVAAILARAQALQFLASRPGGVGASAASALSRAAGRWLPERLLRQHPGDPIAVSFQDMLPELVRQLGRADVARIAREISMDACWAALGVLTAMACANVRAVGLRGGGDPHGGADEAARLELVDAGGGVVDVFRGRADTDWRGRTTWRQQGSGQILR